MFTLLTHNSSQTFDRWTDALNTAKALMPECKNLLHDIRILDGEEVIWVYSRSHKYPMYVGAGTYRRLSLLFLQELMEEEGQLGGVSDDAIADS